MLFKIKIIYYWLLIKFRKPFRTRKALEMFQQKKLNKFARNILIHSAYYKSYCKLDPIDWNEIPYITKTEFMANFNIINTCNIMIEEAMPFALSAEKNRTFNNEINGITIGLSTGTSGNRGLFLVSENERAQWVALVMSRVIKPRIFQKQKIAFFLRANSNLYASVSSGLFEFKYFDIFKPIEQLLNELHAFAPHIVAAQPSVLMDIAIAQQSGSININPHQIISFAEVLHLTDKSFITTHLKANITEVYQCTEGFLGVSCSNGTMHLNEDFIRFEKEWIDEDKFYPVITDFSRSSQPVVRYKLNDILQVRQTACACGSPLLALEKIIGRDDDVLNINNRKIYPDLLVRRIAISCNQFQNYTISQIGPYKLFVQIECAQPDYASLVDKFKEAIYGLLVELGITNVEIECKREPVRIAGNKLRKVSCKI
jgi:putative adenylate-forming enzyme